MTISELLQYCMAKPGAEQSVHQRLESDADQSGRCTVCDGERSENRPAVSLKTSPELAELLRQQHSDVRQKPPSE